MCQCVFFSWPLSKSEKVLHLNFSRKFCDHLVFLFFFYFCDKPNKLLL